jgi:hypothetical protein
MARPYYLNSGVNAHPRYGGGHYGARALSGLGDEPLVTTTITYDDSADQYPGTTYEANPSATLPSGTTMGPTYYNPNSPANVISNFVQGSFFKNYGGLLLVGGGLLMFAWISRKRH